MDQGRRDYGKRNWEPRKRPEFPDENLQIIIYDLSPTITKEDVKYILSLFVRCLHFPEIKTKEDADKCIERLEYSNTTTCWYITFSSQKYRDAILDLDEKILFPDWKYCKFTSGNIKKRNPRRNTTRTNESLLSENGPNGTKTESGKTASDRFREVADSREGEKEWIPERNFDKKDVREERRVDQRSARDNNVHDDRRYERYREEQDMRENDRRYPDDRHRDSRYGDQRDTARQQNDRRRDDDRSRGRAYDNKSENYYASDEKGHTGTRYNERVYDAPRRDYRDYDDKYRYGDRRDDRYDERRDDRRDDRRYAGQLDNYRSHDDRKNDGRYDSRYDDRKYDVRKDGYRSNDIRNRDSNRYDDRRYSDRKYDTRRDDVRTSRDRNDFEFRDRRDNRVNPDDRDHKKRETDAKERHESSSRFDTRDAKMDNASDRNATPSSMPERNVKNDRSAETDRPSKVVDVEQKSYNSDSDTIEDVYKKADFSSKASNLHSDESAEFKHIATSEIDVYDSENDSFSNSSDEEFEAEFSAKHSFRDDHDDHSFSSSKQELQETKETKSDDVSNGTKGDQKESSESLRERNSVQSSMAAEQLQKHESSDAAKDSKKQAQSTNTNSAANQNSSFEKPTTGSIEQTENDLDKTLDDLSKQKRKRESDESFSDMRRGGRGKWRDGYGRGRGRDNFENRYRSGERYSKRGRN